MTPTTKYRIALFFTVLFVAIIAAPSVVLSMDEKTDVSIFYGENEEEEKENLKLLFSLDFHHQTKKSLILLNVKLDCYTIVEYPRPSINLVSPPPDLTV